MIFHNPHRLKIRIDYLSSLNGLLLNSYIWWVYLFGGKHNNRQKKQIAKYSFEFSNIFSNKWTYMFSILVSVTPNERGRKQRLKGTAIGSIFFSLKVHVAPMTIEKNIK